MDVGLLEQKLRALPGVLDCSVGAEGVAVVVHPEVDPRLIELHAQVLLGEAGDRRPLLVVGGMTVGPRVLPSGRSTGTRRPRRSGPSPWSLVGFAALVLVVLAVVPIAGRESGSGDATSAAGVPSGLGRLPVVDDALPTEEAVVAVAAPPAAPAPVPPAVAVAVTTAVTESSEVSVVRLASVAPPPPPAVVPAPAAAAAEPAIAKEKDNGNGSGSGKGRGTGRARGRTAEVRAAVHGAAGATAAMAAPGKGDPPGRRRGHER